MKKTKEVVKLLGVSRQYLHTVLKILRMRPAMQVIVKGKANNYFSDDQIRKLKKVTGR